jgi:CheY-like chemotaxis protein/HPt (histidine-containing phosphotransfer) domain-containing protein
VTQQSIPLTILVVDDDSMSRELLCVLLEAEGYTVTSADSGESALAQLGDSTPPDVVLTDMQMPGTTGAQLACELRQACGPSTLLLAMSGSQPEDNAISQFDGFLLKPFRVSQIAAARSRRAESDPVPAAKKKVISADSNPAHSSISIHASAPETASNIPMQMQVQEPQISLTTADPSASPVLNEKIYRQLADCMPANQLHEMYTLCVNDARECIAVMRSLITVHDATRYVREAHTIKGSCGMLGATQLHGMAAELEERGLDTQEVNSLDELSAACDRLERMLGSRV